jgi:hypothetical protein
MNYFNKLGNSARTYFSKGAPGDVFFRKLQHSGRDVGRAVGSIAPHVSVVVGGLDPTLGKVAYIGSNLVGAGGHALSYGLEHGRRAIHNALEKTSRVSAPQIGFH